MSSTLCGGPGLGCSLVGCTIFGPLWGWQSFAWCAVGCLRHQTLDDSSGTPAGWLSWFGGLVVGCVGCLIIG